MNGRGNHRASLALLLSVACASPGEPAVAGAEGISFAREIEAAIRARDWGKLRRSFLPGASIVHQSSGDIEPVATSPGHWIQGLAEAEGALGYSRTREILDVEVRRDGAMVRSRITEAVPTAEGLVEAKTYESMHVTRDGDALRIGAIGLWFESSSDGPRAPEPDE